MIAITWFCKSGFDSACDATNEAEEAMVYATTLKEDAATLNKYTKKTQQHLEGKKENAACLIMLLHKITTVIEYNVNLTVYFVTLSNNSCDSMSY